MRPLKPGAAPDWGGGPPALAGGGGRRPLLATPALALHPDWVLSCGWLRACVAAARGKVDGMRMDFNRLTKEIQELRKVGGALAPAAAAAACTNCEGRGGAPFRREAGERLEGWQASALRS